MSSFDIEILVLFNNFKIREMKTVLITGANRSIGLELVKELSKKGLFVYLGARDLEKGKAVVNELNQNGFKNIKALLLKYKLS